MALKKILCNRSHAPAILAILNEAIQNSTALYDYHLRSPESMDKWFETKEQHDFPVTGLTDDSGQLLAFGTYGTFRAWPAYKYTVEHSLYVHHDHRGKGLGKMILQELILLAQQQEYHCLIAGIDAMNTSSIQLHKKMGFTYGGRLAQVGYKFDRWLDLEFYQLLLKTPGRPVGG